MAKWDIPSFDNFVDKQKDTEHISLEALTLERAAQVAFEEWASSKDAAAKLFEMDYVGAKEDASKCEGEAEAALRIHHSIRALAPEPAHVTAARMVKIKPLEWFDFDDGSASGSDGYEVLLRDDGLFEVQPPGGHGTSLRLEGAFDTPKTAKAAAQADYEARIRSAIVEAGAALGKGVGE